MTVEYFPNKSRVKNGSPGLVVKLPLGYHIHTGKRSCMLDQNFQPIEVHGSDFAEVSKCSLNALKRIISTQSGNRGEKNEESRQVDTCLDEFGNLSESVKVVLERCNLMRYLCQKARTTGYLSHFERLSVLYVFGHLGEEGKAFVHTVMEFTLNYQHHVTERFIQKLPEKPVSCLKLRTSINRLQRNTAAVAISAGRKNAIHLRFSMLSNLVEMCLRM